MDRSEGSEALKFFNVELPDALTVATHTSSEINTTGFTRGLLLVTLGEAAAGATVDVVITHASESGGSFATLYTATQLTQAAGEDEVAYYLDIDLLNPNINPYLKVAITVGSDVIDGAAHMILFGARREPVTQPSDVDELSGSWASGIVVT